MSQRWTSTQLNDFATHYSFLDGIAMLCRAEDTSLEEAKALLRDAVQHQERGITYNSLPIKCRVLKAALENFSQTDAISVAHLLFRSKKFPWPAVDWRSVAHYFEQLTSRGQTS